MDPRKHLIDSYGREIRDLRISVTDRCNFRCTYCLPEEGIDWLPRSELLTFEEITAISRIFVERFYVDSIRLTGGEPTVRAQLPRLVSMLATLKTHEGKKVNLSMTTNGVTLPLIAEPLRDAGLDRINISLDTLRADRFLEITKRPQFERVLEGIEAAQAVGFHPLKLNVVAMKGINDDEIVDFATFGRDRGLQVRFIEFMPLDGANAWDQAAVLSADEILAQVACVYPVEPIPRTNAPATTYRYRDGKGSFGIIPSVTKPFCGDCDRVRLSAEGKIRTCLFALNEHDLRTLVREKATSARIVAQIETIIATKWAGHSIGRVNFIRPQKSMSQIGG
ncbi:GTP 3',8-cyclase MoaA [Ferrimicrobium sp.]|uniref:GTP 3',8-cyclase MoaA n=2 Tax=Ferrimicrobium sp. TaxID=2926050 RepID=UPI002627B68B|nr:GTP 3',8-cyclase MoaA [Ferrimicrobium sp.]